MYLIGEEEFFVPDGADLCSECAALEEIFVPTGNRRRRNFLFRMRMDRDSERFITEMKGVSGSLSHRAKRASELSSQPCRERAERERQKEGERGKGSEGERERETVPDTAFGSGV